MPGLLKSLDIMVVIISGFTVYTSIQQHTLTTPGADTEFFKRGGLNCLNNYMGRDLRYCRSGEKKLHKELLPPLHDARFNSLSAEFSNMQLLPKLYSKH